MSTAAEVPEPGAGRRVMPGRLFYARIAEPRLWAVEVLDLRLAERAGPVLAVAVVQVGPVNIRNVRVTERGGRLRVWLPSTVQGRDLKPALRLEEAVFLELRRAVLEEYRRAVDADPWAASWPGCKGRMKFGPSAFPVQRGCGSEPG